MSQRIRYVKSDGGMLKSVRAFTSVTQGDLLALYNEDTLMGMVVTAAGEKQLDVFHAKNKHDLKKMLKSSLEKLGVEFNKESRVGKTKRETVE